MYFCVLVYDLVKRGIGGTLWSRVQIGVGAAMGCDR